MPTKLFQSVVRQLYAVGIRSVAPFVSGEPLADKRMVGFVEWMSGEFPGLVVGWYTNGSLLTEDSIRRLLACRTIHRFNVSMQGGTKEVYEENMGLSWGQTISNVELLLRINQEMGNLTDVCMNMCVFSKTQATVEAFRSLWEGRATVCLGAFSNFGGLASDVEGESHWLGRPRQLCHRATEHIYVYHNGDVGQCCFDLTGSVVHGNLKTQSLKAVLEGKSYQDMLKAHQELDVANMPPVCRECNSCKFNG